MQINRNKNEISRFARNDIAFLEIKGRSGDSVKNYLIVEIQQIAASYFPIPIDHVIPSPHTFLHTKDYDKPAR